MKFGVTRPAQESFVLGVLFGIFVLPWLLISAIGTIYDICLKIKQHKDKKDPSRKLDRMITWLKDGMTDDMFTVVNGYDDDGEPKYERCIFDKLDKKSSFPVKGLPDHDDLLNKWKKWTECCDAIAAITDMNGAGQAIQKAFAKHFTNKDLFTSKNKNDVEFTGVNVVVKDSRYPDDKWFKPHVIETTIKELNADGNKCAASIKKISDQVKKCLEAPKTHKDDKDYLVGCLNYINTVDKIIDITSDLIYCIQDVSDAMEKSWYKLHA